MDTTAQCMPLSVLMRAPWSAFAEAGVDLCFEGSGVLIGLPAPFRLLIGLPAPFRLLGDR